jgi:hypothetical protein
MSTRQPEERSDKADPSLGPRYGIASILIASLAFVIVVGVLFVGNLLEAFPFSKSFGATNVWAPIPEPPIQSVLEIILLGASVLPFLGLTTGFRGRLKVNGSKRASAIGLVANSVLSLIVVICFMGVLWINGVMAKVEGVFLINDKQPHGPVLFLEGKNTYTRMETTKEDGSFTIYGIPPGEYVLSATSYLPPPAACASVSSDNDYEVLSPSSTGYRIYVAVTQRDITIPPGPFKSVSFDFRLECQLDKGRDAWN